MSNFNWYTGSTSSQTEQFDERSFTSQPVMIQEPSIQQQQIFNQYEQQHFDQHIPQQFSSVQQPFDGSSPSHPQQVHDFVLPQSGPNEKNNIYIHADNVFIQSGEHHDHEGPVNVTHVDSHPHDTETKKTTTTTAKDSTGDVKKSTTVTEHKDANPIGVPSAHQAKPISEGHPPSQTSQQVSTSTSSSTSSHDPLAQPTHGNVADKTVPPLSTDNSHTSTMPASDIAPATTGAPIPPSSSSSSTGPAPLPPTMNVQTSENDHPPVGTKPEKKHRTMKERYASFKQRLHGHKGSVNGDVHPKDSRDGKALPSQNELSQRQVTEPHGNSADQPVIHKDANDATGKSVTGSDANPSKASMPFKVPAPSLNQAPVDAKAQ